MRDRSIIAKWDQVEGDSLGLTLEFKLQIRFLKSRILLFLPWLADVITGNLAEARL
jgi:hypothetical protein